MQKGKFMVIQHNLMALFADRENKSVKGRLKKSSEKLSSGYRINRSADDAAGLAISEEMRQQIRGLNRGAVNILEGIGYCQTADGALNEMHDILQRINELAIQAANGTNSDDDRAYLADEVEQLKTELDRICTTTKYNEEYIFKTNEALEDIIMPYELSFSGFPSNIYIYNETYNDETGAVTYGGIAYNGKRYAWSGISAAMYDKKTGTFQEGTYTLKADDGTWITLECKNGDEPPKVTCEYTTKTDSKGIYVNGELIKWEDVRDALGNSINTEYVDPQEYYFNYHGVTVSFTVETGDSFFDVTSKLSNTLWKSTYRLPYENTALYGNFSQTTIAFQNNQEVKSYLENNSINSDSYVIRASEDGVWLELNGAEVTDSLKTWGDLGITNWGDQSTDIWENITYTYSYEQNDTNEITFSFNVINETSKDSVIDALDGVVLTPSPSVIIENHAELELSGNNDNLLGAEIVRDALNITLKEEYGLGRDYSQNPDAYNDAKIEYDKDGNSISMSFSDTVDGITTQKNYSMTVTELNNLVESIKKTIKNNVNSNISSLDIIKARYLAGAKDAMLTDLVTLISPDNITGGGGSTYLEDVYEFHVSDSNLKTTLQSANSSYAGAVIDFSGLGDSYDLVDLVGMGFNSTCQTCSNHYSVQFMTSDTVDTAWKSATIDGNEYQYSMEQQGNNYTLYIDVASMQGTISDGVDFTNALVSIIDAAGYDFHFTQYATYSNTAELYLFDNRPEYVQDGTSTATNADFQPYAHDANAIADFTVRLYDEDKMANSIGIRYEYNFADVFEEIISFAAEPDPDGKYVYNSATQKYEFYDPDNNPEHASMTDPEKYTINDVFLGLTDEEFDAYLEEYIRENILSAVTDTTISLVGDSAAYKVSANVNDNVAMITQYNTPRQVMPVDIGDLKGRQFLNIQCSSNANDFIRIPKQRLSLQRLGLLKVSVKTESDATNSIALMEKALKKVSTVRSAFGAYQNRLEHTYAINQNTAENTQYSESKIRDTDMADEMVKYSNANILVQAGQSMLAQANQSKQGVLNLL